MGSSTLVLLGVWMGVIGYGIAYSGVAALRGQPCSIGDAFRNRCGTPAPPIPGATGGGRTLAQRHQELHDRQLRHLSRQPLLVRA